MESAAAALLCGWDPIAYLSLDGVEQLTAAAVLRLANDRRGEEMARQAEAVGHHAAVALSKVFGG